MFESLVLFAFRCIVRPLGQRIGWLHLPRLSPLVASAVLPRLRAQMCACMCACGVCVHVCDVVCVCMCACVHVCMCMCVCVWWVLPAVRPRTPPPIKSLLLFLFLSLVRTVAVPAQVRSVPSVRTSQLCLTDISPAATQERPPQSQPASPIAASQLTRQSIRLIHPSQPVRSPASQAALRLHPTAEASETARRCIARPELELRAVRRHVRLDPLHLLLVQTEV